MLEEFIRSNAKKVAADLDNRMYEWLEEQGIHLERGNVEQIIALRDKLAAEDKQIRCETAVVDFIQEEDSYKCITKSLIFYDSLSNPLTRDAVEDLIKRSYELENKE